MKKWMLGLFVFFSVFAITGFIGFYSTIFLIGPHSDILPDWLHIPVGIILLLLIIAIPVWLANKVYTVSKHREIKNLKPKSVR